MVFRSLFAFGFTLIAAGSFSAVHAAAATPERQQASAERVEPAGQEVTTPASLELNAATGKFQSLRVGMSALEVNEVLGRQPDIYHTYESGKRWIPFYFGSDAVRLQALYKGEGCLIFSAGFRYQNHGIDWVDFSGTLAEITLDPSSACYKP